MHHTWLLLLRDDNVLLHLHHPRDRRRRLHRLQLRPRLSRDGASGVVNLDKLTYAGNLDNLAPSARDPRHVFVRGDICDRALVDAPARRAPAASGRQLRRREPRRSLDRRPRRVRRAPTSSAPSRCSRPRAATGARCRGAERATRFRFLHVSTDEVYGSLGPTGLFTEETPVRAQLALRRLEGRLPIIWCAPTHHTYGLPTLTTNCSNNYGPLPVPGKADPADDPQRARGQAAAGLRRRAERARLALRRATTARRSASCSSAASPARRTTSAATTSGPTSHIVQRVCDPARRARRRSARGSLPRGSSPSSPDRPGHDRRYAIDAAQDRARARAGRPAHTFEPGLRETVRWYLDHRDWCARHRAGVYRRERLGLSTADATGA